MKKKKEDCEGKEKKPLIRFQKDDLQKYESKLQIESDLDSVLKVFVSNTFPFLKKRKGNVKVKIKRKKK